MNRKELAAAIAEHAGTPANQADRFLTALEQVLVAALAEGLEVSLPGFLSVKTVERSARTGRNPQSGEPMEIPAKKGVKVTAGSRLKAAVGS